MEGSIIEIDNYLIEPADKANIVLIGNSGVGKTTLIKTLLADEDVQTETTKELKLYDCPQLNFRLIDTMGFEYSYLKQAKAINAIKKWSKESIKNNESDRQINMIWYCIDGTSKRFVKKHVDMFIRSTSIWRNVPIIVVITKSYSKLERDENVRMVRETFRQHPEANEKLKAIIPVVAYTYPIDDGVNVLPYGLDELLIKTEELIPEGMDASSKDISIYQLKQKRMIAHSLVGASTLAAATIGLSPIPFSDGVLLTPLEVVEIKNLAKVYNIDTNEKSNVIQTIVEAGAAGIVGKTALGILNAIPIINVAAEVLNAVVAASVVAALGEGCIFVFEQIENGSRSADDLDWIKNVVESEATSKILKKLNPIIEEIQEKARLKKINTKDIVAIILKNIKEPDKLSK